MEKPVVLAPDIHSSIRNCRGVRVILDSDLAAIYGVPTFRFNEAVRRNIDKFPSDFLFQLTKEEVQSLISQSAISKTGRGGRRSLPWAFTEHGALQAANAALEKRLAVIEKTLTAHDNTLRDVILKIRPLLLSPTEPNKRRIGFHTND